MYRATQPKMVDLIVNHPEVRPTMEKGDHRIDSSDVVLNLRNVVFVFDVGVVLFIYAEPGVYEGHIGFLRCGRGAVAVGCGREALDRLFTDHGAQRVSAAVPLQLPGARYLCRRLGFASLGADHGAGVEHFVKEA